MLEEYGHSNVLTPITLCKVSTLNLPIKVKTFTKNYVPIVVKFLIKYHFRQSRLWRMIGAEKNDLIEYLHIMLAMLNEGTSFIAINPRCKKKVLGFIIGNIREAVDVRKENRGIRKYRCKTVEAVMNLYNCMHDAVDFYTIHNTKVLYNIQIWMVDPKLKSNHYVAYEMYISLLKFCGYLDIKTITAVATEKKTKKFAERVGFHQACKIDYETFFRPYNLKTKKSLENKFGFAMSLVVEETRHHQRYVDQHYTYISLPKLTSTSKRKRKEQDYLHTVFWSLLERDFITPLALLKYKATLI